MEASPRTGDRLPGPASFAVSFCLDPRTTTVLHEATTHDQFLMNTDVFVRGLTRALRGVGIPDGTACQVYVLHTPGGGCPGIWLP